VYLTELVVLRKLLSLLVKLRYSVLKVTQRNLYSEAAFGSPPF
jgi:hypothetical protein